MRLRGSSVVARGWGGLIHTSTAAGSLRSAVGTFDGKGGLTASESFNSELTGPQTRNVVCSYQVQPTCGFTLLFPSTLGAQHEVVGACVLVDNAREFYCLDVENGWVATALGKKI